MPLVRVYPAAQGAPRDAEIPRNASCAEISRICECTWVEHRTILRHEYEKNDYEDYVVTLDIYMDEEGRRNNPPRNQTIPAFLGTVAVALSVTDADGDSDFLDYDRIVKSDVLDAFMAALSPIAQAMDENTMAFSQLPGLCVCGNDPKLAPLLKRSRELLEMQRDITPKVDDAVFASLVEDAP